MRYRSGFCPSNICLDPITATLLVVGTVASGMAAASAYSNSKKQAKAVAAEGALKARQRDLQTRRLASSQKTSFLNSGISLTGEGDVADVIMSDTYTTGLEDVNQIKDNYNQQSKNIMGAARAKLIGDIGGMALNIGMAGVSSGMFAGQTSATGLAGSGAASGQIGTGAGAGFGMAAPAGVSRVGFMNGVPMSM